jgi:hypothetical protein
MAVTSTFAVEKSGQSSAGPQLVGVAGLPHFADRRQALATALVHEELHPLLPSPGQARRELPSSGSARRQLTSGLLAAGRAGCLRHYTVRDRHDAFGCRDSPAGNRDREGAWVVLGLGLQGEELAQLPGS